MRHLSFVSTDIRWEMTNVSDDRCHMTQIHMALWVSMERYEPQESDKDL